MTRVSRQPDGHILAMLSSRTLVFVGTGLALSGCSSNASNPASPSFHLTAVPRGWCTHASSLSADPPDAKRTVTLFDPASVQYAVNVVASSEPLDPPHDRTRAYAKSQGKLLREELDGYVEQSSSGSQAYDGRGQERAFSWDPADAPRVWQLQVYYAADGVGYTATATAVEHQGPKVRKRLRAIVESVRLVKRGQEDLPPDCVS